MKTPSFKVSQSTEDPPEVVGISFSCDVIRRYKQMILVVRECSTSFTSSCLIPDEKHDTLRDALTRLLVGLNPLDGPRAVLRVDPATSFVALANDDSLMHINVCIEVGRVKNKNKNPVAEKAVSSRRSCYARSPVPVLSPKPSFPLPQPASTPAFVILAYLLASYGHNAASSTITNYPSPTTTSSSPNTSKDPSTIAIANAPNTQLAFRQRYHPYRSVISSICTLTRIRIVPVIDTL